MNTHSIDYDGRRQFVFLILSGIFLGAMTMLNILGITRFIQLGPLSTAVGVLPYPLTFICTDLICEFYGKRKANQLVIVGLLVNLMVIGFVWIAAHVPSIDPSLQPPWQNLHLSKPVTTPDGSVFTDKVEMFQILYATTLGAVFASMVAYMLAQFCDVYMFHFWKRVTKGKHLWLRNNGSTMVSQAVDTAAVVGVTFGTSYWQGKMDFSQVVIFFWGGYTFKLIAAAFDTPVIYVVSRYLSPYLNINPQKDHGH